jgi:hypothetical protein
MDPPAEARRAGLSHAAIVTLGAPPRLRSLSFPASPRHRTALRSRAGGNPVPPAGITARDPHAAAIAEASARFAIPEHWIRAVIAVESAGNPARGQPCRGHGADAGHARNLGRAARSSTISATTRSTRATTSSPGPPICARCSTATAIVAAMLAAYNAGPGRYDAISGPGVRCPPRPAPMSRRSPPAGRQRTAAWTATRHRLARGRALRRRCRRRHIAGAAAVRTRPRPHRETFRPAPARRSSCRARAQRRRHEPDRTDGALWRAMASKRRQGGPEGKREGRRAR